MIEVVCIPRLSFSASSIFYQILPDVFFFLAVHILWKPSPLKHSLRYAIVQADSPESASLPDLPLSRSILNSSKKYTFRVHIVVIAFQIASSQGVTVRVTPLEALVIKASIRFANCETQ